MSLLDELCAAARERARRLPAHEPDVPRRARASFTDAIRGRERLSVIAEFKRESPSRGAIAPHAVVAEQVRRYARAGARAISVVTEPTRFAGTLDDLVEAATAVTLPVLMKDFVVDEAQVRAAAQAGAAAVLLIVRCLPPAQLRELAGACVELGLTPLVECHDAAELDAALAIEHAVIGVNNRDLDTLAIDATRAARLLPRVPADRVAVAESGYLTAADTRPLRGAADAVLIGTALMAGGDPEAFIREVCT